MQRLAHFKHILPNEWFFASESMWNHWGFEPPENDNVIVVIQWKF